MNLTTSQYKEYLKTGKLPDQPKPQKKNKYNASKTEYNGHLYDSKREARHAQELDLLIKAGEVQKWERQFKIEIEVEGNHICSYFIDFKVWKPDRIEYHEVKGKETALWKMKWKLVHSLYPEWTFVLIK